MPKLRAEQIQSLTLTDAQISDGKRYGQNGTLLEGFDPSRLIDQSKIRDLEYQPNGWISRGIINKVDVLPDWQAEYEGRLFYVNNSDELFLGIGTEPWYILVSGSSASGWDAELTVRTGFDGTNWNGTMATQFQTLSYTFSPDGSDLFVYLNGSLQRLDHDYELVDQKTIRMTRNIGENDTVTMLVHLSNSLLNYATKSWVNDQIQSGGIQHSLDNAYDDGSIISVDNTNVDFRLRTDNSFVVSEAASSIPLPAVHIGTEDLTFGHNWQTKWQSFDVVTRVGGNVVGPNRAYLNSPAVNANEVATEISESLVNAGVTGLFGYNDNNKIGIQSTAVGNDISFEIYSGTNALPIFGLDADSFIGDDAYSSYQEFGLNHDPDSVSGLAANEKFWFGINGTQYSINTGIGTTYSQLRSIIDSKISADGFTATTEGNDIRITRDEPGLSFPTNIDQVFGAGQIEITQVTTSADVDRSLDAKHFLIKSIDKALFGHQKNYYVWYHLDSEQEVTEIIANSESSNVTLADSFLQINTPINDYFIWYEVETPQTSGYQELGLSAITAETDSGLTQDTTYKYKVAVDGNAEQTFSITTPPDIQPTAEITEVTIPSDFDKSLSGKYWSLTSQTGTGYYVWYNINTPAAPEVTTVTTIGDTNQDLSGKAFYLYAPNQQYYAWLSMMTDAGQPALPEVTKIQTVADSSLSLSSKYFALDSADGTQHYIWYQLQTDPGVTGTKEITEVTTFDNVSQSLSGKHFEFSSTETDYYAWYRQQIAAPVSGSAEETEIVFVQDVAKSLSSKYWTFNTPYNDYYVWYRMETNAQIPAVGEVSEFEFTSNVGSEYDGQRLKLYNFSTVYDLGLYEGLHDTFTASSDGWSGDSATISTSADSITLTSTGIDPMLIKSGLSIDGSKNTIVEARIKRIAGSGWDGKVFYVTPGHSFDSGYYAYMLEPVYEADGWAIIQWDMADLNDGGTDWVDSTITAVRLDLGNSSADVFEIDYIKIRPNTSSWSNPLLLLTTSTDVATSIADGVANTIANSSWPFTASAVGSVLTTTSNNPGAQLHAPIGDVDITASISVPGADLIPATFSTNPSPAGKTGIQVNIVENETNTDVAIKTNNQLALLGDISTVLSGSKVTITNDDNGAVSDATDVNSGIIATVTNQGITTAPAQYSTNPMVAGKTGVVVDIDANELADNVATKTAVVINALPEFTATSSNDIITITNNTDGAVNSALAGDSGFSINITQEGLYYVAPTYSADPAPTSRTGHKVQLAVNATAATVALNTKNVIDAITSFSASSADDVITITDATTGTVTDAIDVDTTFSITTFQQGQEYIAPTYTTNPSLTGIGIKVDINENSTSTFIAQAIETAIGSTVGFSTSRVNDVVTITNSVAGVANNSVDVNSGFDIVTTIEGYEAYSSTDPSPASKTGIMVTIVKNEDADLVAAKTQIALNANTHFSASVSSDVVTVVDRNGGIVADAIDFNAGVLIDVINQGTDIVYADVSYGQIITLLNASTTSNATWSIDGGDIRLTSNTIGSWTSIAQSDDGLSDSLYDALSASLGTIQSGTSSYSAQPSGFGTPLRVPVLVGSPANIVASKTAAVLNTETDFSVVLDTNKLTITNTEFGATSGIVDSGTLFSINTLNSGADESLDPNIPGATAIQVDVIKNDNANTIATKTQTAIDLGGEFYVTRLDNSLAIQNDFAGSVDASTDVNTGFILTQTGVGVDVKYNLFGANGLNVNPRASVAGIDPIPASTGVGTKSLVGGYNYFTFPKDFVVSINNGTDVEISLDAACYNSSEIVSHINTKILGAGVTNLEAYQVAGKIGLRTLQTGLSQTLDLKNSTTDALQTLGWTAGTYSGDFGTAESIMTVTALDGQNNIVVNADILPSGHGLHDIGAEGNKFKDLYVQSVYADAGTIYIGKAKISEETNSFAFIVDDGINTYDFFGNTDATIGPVGASRIGIPGITGVIPERAGANPGDVGTLEEMLTGLAKSSGGSKVFPDMSTTGASYGNPTDLKGFLLEKAKGLYLKLDEILEIKELNRRVIILQQGTGVVENVDWKFLDDKNTPISGRSVKFDLTELDANKEPTSGTLADDSFHVKTTGGIKLETGSAEEVQITNDLRVGGDLIVEGDTVTLNTSVLDVEDNMITLNKNVSGTPTLDSGFEIERGSSVNSRLIWDESDDIFRAGLNGTEKAIAMRADNQISTGVAYWDNASATFKTDSTMTVTSSSEVKFSGSIQGPDTIGSKIDNFEKIYNAVWNDIADFINVENTCDVEYGKCYYISSDFTHSQSTKACQKGVLGIASDTYGYGLGKDDNKNQLPIAVGGFVLAYIIGDVEPGDVLTSGPDGYLTVMTLEDKRDYPERIVATYYKPQIEDEYHGLIVDGRHWVKVK